MAQRKISVELEANTGKATSEIERLIDAINDMNKNISDFGKDGKKALDGVEKEGKKATKSLGALEKITKGLFVIEALEAAFGFFKETLGQNQQVVNLFNTTFEALSLAFNDFFNFLNNNIGTVVEYFKNIFSDPKQAVYDFATAIYENLIERFNSLLDSLGFLATAVKKVFEGDFAGALESVKSAGKEAVDVITGVPDSFDKIVEAAPSVIKGITDYTKSTIKAAQETVELNRAAEIGIAQNRIILEQKDREAEKLRQIRDDETKTIAERIEANNKLKDVLDEQERLMLANADAVIAAAQAQFDKNQNDENQIALLDARAEKEGILAQIEGFRSEQLININSLERERLDLIDEEAEKKREAAEEEIELSKAVAEAKIADSTNTLNMIAQLAGEGSEIGKAAAVASATISGIEGVQNAYTTAQKSPITAFFPAYPIVQAGLAAAFSAKQIQTILSTQKPTVGGGGGGSAPSTPAPPSFNVVGAAPENQLAETIGQQEQKPVKAFVVSQEVSSQQALDRNIESSASIG